MTLETKSSDGDMEHKSVISPSSDNDLSRPPLLKAQILPNFLRTMHLVLPEHQTPGKVWPFTSAGEKLIHRDTYKCNPLVWAIFPLGFLLLRDPWFVLDIIVKIQR